MNLRWNTALLLLVLLIGCACSASGQSNLPTDSTSGAWLKVVVETDWGFFWQKSTGRVYVMDDPKNPHRVKAGKLFVQIMAHDTTTVCMENADSAVVFEKKRGIAISKKTARVTAWSESPNLKPVSESLKP